jgi:hypothetical protein
VRRILPVLAISLAACTAPAAPPGDSTRPCTPSDEAPPAMPAPSMPPGILAHQALIEPVLHDFDLEVVEQSRIPQHLEPTMSKADGTVVTPPPVRRWWVEPSFLVRVKGADAEPLDTLQADAVALGVRGTWVFPHRAAAGLFARAYRIQRRKHCYDVSYAGPNFVLTFL